MNFRTSLIGAGILAVALAACREADKPLAPSGNARVEVTSDPAGGTIFLDGTNTGKVTPDLLRDLIGQHEILVRLDRDNIAYGFRTQVDVKGDSLHRIYGPLTMRCTSAECAILSQKYHTLGRLRISTNPNGALFYYDGTGRGLYYPAGLTDTYAAIGMPLIAMLAGTRDTLSVGIYDVGYLAGRPAPAVATTAERYTMRQSFWLVPPTSIISTNAPTARGIEVEEELIGVNATSDVAFIKLTFRNITNRASYQAADPIVPSAGIRFDSVYVGFGLDADIGSADDDVITYDPTQNMVYAYDSDFQESIYAATNTSQPALVGLRLLDAPAGTAKVLNAWARSNDWGAGDVTARQGWNILSGRKSVAPDAPGQLIGHVPTAPADYRMSVSAGPISLAAGAQTSITVAVIVAPPAPGTYVSGQVVAPGDPNAPDRTIAKIAAALLEKARGLVAPN